MTDVSKIFWDFLYQGKFSALGWLEILTLISVVVGILYVIVSRGFEALWLAGYDRNRRLVVFKRLLSVFLVIIGFLWFVDYIGKASKLLGLVFLLAIVVILVFSLRNVISNLIAGMVLIIQNQISMGSWMSIGAISGRVQAIRPLQAKLKTSDGQTIYIPNKELLGNVTSIKSRDAGFLFEMTINLAGTNLSLEDLETIAIASPYRRASSDVNVMISGVKDQKVATFQFYLWSARLLYAAQHHLQQAIALESTDAAPVKN